MERMRSVWPPAMSVLGLGVVVVAGLAAVAHYADGPSAPKLAVLGTIHVDQPEIYTRERLVNDRFEQDDWLRSRLAKTNELTFDANARVRSERSRQVTSETTLGSTATPPTGSPALPTSVPDAPVRPASDPIDDFADRVAYREEVRGEIIENQLDDTHDIAGNTLYHLKFDAAVIPFGDNVGAFAVVDAAVNGPTPRYFTCEGLVLADEAFDNCAQTFVEDLETVALTLAVERVAGNERETTQGVLADSGTTVEERERRQLRSTLKDELAKTNLLSDSGAKLDALRKLAGMPPVRGVAIEEQDRILRSVREEFDQSYELYQNWLEQASLEVNIAMRSKRELILNALGDLNGNRSDTRQLSVDDRLQFATLWLREFALEELESFEL